MTKLPLSRRRMLQASAAAGAAAAVTGATAPYVYAAGDTLRVRNYSDIQVLDPGYILSAPETDVLRATLPSLIEFVPGDTWDWQLSNAESIEQVDDTHINFTLKPGMGWTNGNGPVTADDVKFSFERIADPEMASPYAEDWSALDHVEVTGELSGTIVLKQPYAPLWTTTLPSISGYIVSRKAVEGLEGKRYEAQMPAASGPYQITDWSPSQKLVLSRIDGWTGSATPDFATIEVLPIVDEQAAEVGFLSGDLDFTTVPITSIPELESNPPDNAVLVMQPSLKYVWMGINEDNPQFTDIRVRQAVQYAVNVNQILEAAYFGLAAPATGIVPPGLVGHRASALIPDAGDPDYARKLLEEAGLGGGFDCRIDVLNKSTYTAACQVIQANLAEVGINAEINVHDPGVWWTMGDEATNPNYNDLQIMYSRFSSNPDPGWYTMWFTPQQVGVWNWERWDDETFQNLHQQALVTMDPAVRQGMYEEMQNLMEESGCYRFITHELTASLFSNNIVPALHADGTMVWKDFRKA